MSDCSSSGDDKDDGMGRSSVAWDEAEDEAEDDEDDEDEEVGAAEGDGDDSEDKLLISRTYVRPKVTVGDVT